MSFHLMPHSASDYRLETNAFNRFEVRKFNYYKVRSKKREGFMGATVGIAPKMSFFRAHKGITPFSPTHQYAATLPISIISRHLGVVFLVPRSENTIFYTLNARVSINGI